MKNVCGYVGVACAKLVPGHAQTLFGPAKAGEETIYEPLAINGITLFSSYNETGTMYQHLQYREDVEDAWIGLLSMVIAENEEECTRRFFMGAPQLTVVLPAEIGIDFIGEIDPEKPRIGNIPGTSLRFNKLTPFCNFDKAMQAKIAAEEYLGKFCPLATFELTPIPD